MSTEASDLPLGIKKQVIEELKLRKYVLDDEKPIGKGAFGYVYRTKSTVKKELGACKVILIPGDLSKKKKVLSKSVQEEICALKILAGDSRIVPIRFSKMFSEFVMIGMEYCAGGSLEQYVNGRNGEAMEESLLKSMTYQILSAMFDYSDKGIVHRDIKPENILIDEFGRIKISDFGLARETNGQSKLSTRTIAGTKRYLSPELDDKFTQSIKSDVWALGLVILELAYGRNAFLDSEMIRMDKIKVRKIIKHRGGYSSGMIEFLAKCIEPKYGERATVEDLLKDKWFNDVDMNRIVTLIESPKNKAVFNLLSTVFQKVLNFFAIFLFWPEIFYTYIFMKIMLNFTRISNCYAKDDNIISVPEEDLINTTISEDGFQLPESDGCLRKRVTTRERVLISQIRKENLTSLFLIRGECEASKLLAETEIKSNRYLKTNDSICKVKGVMRTLRSVNRLKENSFLKLRDIRKTVGTEMYKNVVPSDKSETKILANSTDKTTKLRELKEQIRENNLPIFTFKKVYRREKGSNSDQNKSHRIEIMNKLRLYMEKEEIHFEIDLIRKNEKGKKIIQRFKNGGISVTAICSVSDVFGVGETEVFDSSVYTDVFMSWFKRTVRYYTREKTNRIGQPIVFFLDSCDVHNKKEMIEIAEKTGNVVLFNAPCSCAMNPIENIFAKWKTRCEERIRNYYGFESFLNELNNNLRSISIMEIASEIAYVDMKIFPKVDRRENL